MALTTEFCIYGRTGTSEGVRCTYSLSTGELAGVSPVDSGSLASRSDCAQAALQPTDSRFKLNEQPNFLI